LVGVVQDEAKISTAATAITVISKHLFLFISCSPLKLLLFKRVFQASNILSHF
jgi:hypothetical protein